MLMMGRMGNRSPYHCGLPAYQTNLSNDQAICQRGQLEGSDQQLFISPSQSLHFYRSSKDEDGMTFMSGRRYHAVQDYGG